MNHLLRWASPAASLAVITLVLSSLTAQGDRRPLRGLQPGQLAEVEKVGTGDRVLVLLPCMSGRWRTFDTFMKRNAERYTMYAVTIPGYGGTPFPELERNGDGTPWRDNALAGLEALFREEKIEKAALVGHSWGTSLAVAFASRHTDRVSHIINLDGFLYHSAKTEQLTDAGRRAKADSIVAEYTAKLATADGWARFSRCSIPDMERRVLHHGMFMATDRSAMLQYWRENFIVRLNDKLRSTVCPILDIHTVAKSSAAGHKAAADRLSELAALGVDERVNTVTWFGVGHFVHELMPQAVDASIAAFLAGKKVRSDWPSSNSATADNVTVGVDKNVDQRGKAFQGWAMREPRAGTRLIYFHKTVDEAKPWDSSPGELAIEYGPVGWRPDAFDRLERAAFPRWRMGMNHWSNLDAGFDFRVGGERFTAGYYYIFLERDKGGDWRLCLLDPSTVAKPELDAWHANRRDIPAHRSVPVKYEVVDDVAPKLAINFKLTNKANHRQAELEIRYGPHRLTVPLEAIL